MNRKEVEQTIEKVLTSDARTKAFRKKLLKLGYVKKSKEVNAVMEKIADFSMMSDAGNKKIARAVSQAKNEKDLKARLMRYQPWQRVNTQKQKKMRFIKEL